MLFGNSEQRIICELQHHFDGLPIQIGLLPLLSPGGATEPFSWLQRSGQRETLQSKLDPTGNQQCYLRMTPLHILACSSVHDLELYRVIVEKYPANLILKIGGGITIALCILWGRTSGDYNSFLGAIKHFTPITYSIRPIWWRQWEGVIHPRRALRTCFMWNKCIPLISQSIGCICLTSLQSIHISYFMEHQIRKDCNFSSCVACHSMCGSSSLQSLA